MIRSDSEVKRQEIFLKDELETEQLGISLARELKPKDVIGLTGDIGAGKTCLTKGIAKGLMIDEPITSPTFTIVHEYHTGRLPLYHFDVYRLNGPDDMFELGFEEYLYGNGVCIIEWSDIVEELLPEGAIRINIEYDSVGRFCRIERK